MRFSIVKKNKASQKNHIKMCFTKLLREGMMPTRRCGAHAFGMSPTERLKLRRQMAFAADKKKAHFFLFMEAYGLEVEEGLSTMATQFGRMESRAERSLDDADS